MEADSWWEKIYHSDAWQVVVPIDAHRLRREPNVFVPKVKELMPWPGRPRRRFHLVWRPIASIVVGGSVAAGRRLLRRAVNSLPRWFPAFRVRGLS